MEKKRSEFDLGRYEETQREILDLKLENLKKDLIEVFREIQCKCAANRACNGVDFKQFVTKEDIQNTVENSVQRSVKATLQSVDVFTLKNAKAALAAIVCLVVAVEVLIRITGFDLILQRIAF